MVFNLLRQLIDLYCLETTAISPVFFGTTLSSSRETSFQTASEMGSCELSSLLSCSMREARLTTSPVTLYSLWIVDPTVPTNSSPGFSPIPIYAEGMRPTLFSSLTHSTIVRAALTPFRLLLTWHSGAPQIAMSPSSSRGIIP